MGYVFYARSNRLSSPVSCLKLIWKHPENNIRLLTASDVINVRAFCDTNGLITEFKTTETHFQIQAHFASFFRL